ncbi:hypothetical protein E05_35700 [Plautia stali symbiont]|nr:hypothetical protein E05_35700 [Plautia stali symbiont]
MPEPAALPPVATEARGLSPAYSCRAGHCGSCKTRLVKGAVTYPTRPSMTLAQDEVLICCTVPAQVEDGDAGVQLAL